MEECETFLFSTAASLESVLENQPVFIRIPDWRSKVSLLTTPFSFLFFSFLADIIRNSKVKKAAGVANGNAHKQLDSAENGRINQIKVTEV